MHTKIKTYFSALTRFSFVFCIFAFASCGFSAGKTCNKDNNDKAEPYNSAGEPNSEKMVVMKFDIKAFNANNKYGVYKFIDTNGMEVEQHVLRKFPSGETESYYEYRCFPDSPYKFYSDYDDKGNIIEYIKSFSTFHVGIGLHYDSIGNIVKEEDFDLPYKFSLEDLIDKMKEEYDVDLLSKKTGSVNRFLEQEHLGIPVYIVNCRITDTPFKHVYIINGTTGEMLYTTKRLVMETDEEKEYVLDEYIRKKANGEL